MNNVRLIFQREDVERVLSSAVESGRLLAGQGGGSYDFLRGYVAALRLVSTGFGFQLSASETEQPGGLTPHASGAGLTLLRKRGIV